MSYIWTARQRNDRTGQQVVTIEPPDGFDYLRRTIPPDAVQCRLTDVGRSYLCFIYRPIPATNDSHSCSPISDTFVWRRNQSQRNQSQCEMSVQFSTTFHLWLSLWPLTLRKRRFSGIQPVWVLKITTSHLKWFVYWYLLNRMIIAYDNTKIV